MTLDQFNSIFPFIACTSHFLNIRKLLRDKQVLGVHWAAPLITYLGQISGIYFMYTLGQWYTMVGGATFFALSFTWYCMMIYYNYFYERKTETPTI
jgi:hypothetical protein